jgi:ABC-type dipeptide/oligopeptide/nickel transport system permease component
MSAEAEAVSRTPGARVLDRLAAAFLLLLLGLGTLVLWIGIPAGILWALSKLTESSTKHFLLALVLIPTAMVLFAIVLAWVNALYLRVIGAMPSEEDEEGGRWRWRGPLGLFLSVSMVVALVALIVWMLFIADHPTLTVW